MTGTIVNLRTARKAKARLAKQQKAEENRALHGRTKAQKAADKDEKRKADQALDGHKRER